LDKNSFKFEAKERKKLSEFSEFTKKINLEIFPTNQKKNSMLKRVIPKLVRKIGRKEILNYSQTSNLIKQFPEFHTVRTYAKWVNPENQVKGQEVVSQFTF
jgi:hypothetical protein